MTKKNPTPSRDAPPERPPDDLSADEMRRYGRHLVMPQVGPEGQKRLRRAKVLLVGTGGLGSPAALYLAAAGVGTLGLVDFDRVDASNLQRQVLFTTDDVGEPKVTGAAARLRALNPHVEVRVHNLRLDASNVRDLVEAYDVVAVATISRPATLSTTPAS